MERIHIKQGLLQQDNNPGAIIYQIVSGGFGPLFLSGKTFRLFAIVTIRNWRGGGRQHLWIQVEI